MLPSAQYSNIPYFSRMIKCATAVTDWFRRKVQNDIAVVKKVEQCYTQGRIITEFFTTDLNVRQEEMIKSNQWNRPFSYILIGLYLLFGLTVNLFHYHPIGDLSLPFGPVNESHELAYKNHDHIVETCLDTTDRAPIVSPRVCLACELLNSGWLMDDAEKTCLVLPTISTLDLPDNPSPTMTDHSLLRHGRAPPLQNI